MQSTIGIEYLMYDNKYFTLKKWTRLNFINQKFI